MFQKMDLWLTRLALATSLPVLTTFRVTLNTYILNYNTSFAVPVAVAVSGCRI